MSGDGKSYAFGPFVLNVTDRQLLLNGQEIPLTHKAFETLHVLVERRGHMVSKQELLKTVWPDCSVEENNLSQNISLLRKALNGAGASDYILTVPKHGYRFNVPVTSEAAAEPLSPDLPDFRPPQTHYIRSGDVNIAYQVLGEGPVDIVFVMGWVSHLEYFWTEPSFARFLRRLSCFARVILFDKRGTGLSDRVPISQLPTLEERMDDVRAVMDAAGSARAVLCGISEGGPMCALFAATHPHMTLAVVMIGTYARRIRTYDYPWGISQEQADHFLTEIETQWGGPVGLAERAPSVAMDSSFREWWAAYLRMSASPGAAVAMTKMNAQIDVRHVLPSVHVPALVIHRTGDTCLSVEGGRYVASKMPAARFVELPGVDHLPFVGNQEEILNPIEEFIAELRHDRDLDRVLATILCINTRTNNWAWSQYESYIQREVDWFGGRLFKAADGSPTAMFDGPARAIRCACAILEHASRLRVDVGLGLHTGECRRSNGTHLDGTAVEITYDIAQRAPAGEVLVSSTVRDLVAGSPYRFEYHDTIPLRTHSGEYRVYQVRTAIASAATDH
jgi:DNA-binding winged helix-turn-helix (wHTH) protein